MKVTEGHTSREMTRPIDTYLVTMVASINYLYSQITKESSHIISLYNRVKSGAEGVKGALTSLLVKKRIFFLHFLYT